VMQAGGELVVEGGLPKKANKSDALRQDQPSIC